MKKNLAAILTVSALAFAGAAGAQTITDSSASGTVVSVTTDSIVVRMDDGTQRTFATDTTTTLPSARLAEGNRINVKYRSLDAGRLQATMVTLDRTPAQDPLTGDTTSSDPVRALPDTASNMPLLALAGGAALAGALALTVLRRAA